MMDDDLMVEMAKLFGPVGQADELYTASIKTFWPGYERRTRDSDGEYHNRLADIDKNTQPYYASVADQQSEVNRIQRSEYSKTHWPYFFSGPQVKVVPTKKQFDAWTTGEASEKLRQVRNVKLHLPTGPWGRSKAVLLHELAHAIEQYEGINKYSAFKERFEDGHGASFAKRNIEVVRAFYSPEMADKLEANFKAEGVVIAP